MDANAEGGIYGKALQVESAKGHEAAVGLLLEKRSIDGHEDVVKLLIAAGADVNAIGGFYGSVFGAADFLGHWSLAKLLQSSMRSSERKNVDAEQVIKDATTVNKSAEESTGTSMK